jgi:hypothetical protein
LIVKTLSSTTWNYNKREDLSERGLAERVKRELQKWERKNELPASLLGFILHFYHEILNNIIFN